MPPPSRRRPRKPHRDKDIEAVLRLKDRWNGQMAQFLWDMRGLSKGINGRGSPDHRLAPAKPTEPLDDTLSSMLSRLSGQYRQLAADALTIIEKQKQLHELKSSLKNDNSERTDNHNPFSSPLSFLSEKKSETDLLLVKEATNPLSRSWFRLKAPFSSKKGVRHLESILLALLDARHAVEEMQDAAVSKGDDSLKRIESSYREFHVKLAFVIKAFQQYLALTGETELLRTSPSVSSGESAYDSQFQFFAREFALAQVMGATKTHWTDLQRLYNNAKNDLERQDVVSRISQAHKSILKQLDEMYLSFEPWKTVSELYDQRPERRQKETEKAEDSDSMQDRLFSHYESELTLAEGLGVKNTSWPGLKRLFQRSESVEQRADLLEKIRMIYAEVIKALRGLYQEESWETVSELFNLKPTLKDSEKAEKKQKQAALLSEAHNVLTRNLKKKMLSLPFSDPHSALRIELFNVLDDARDTITAFMDSIEDGHSAEILAGHVSRLRETYDGIHQARSVLLSALSVSEPSSKKR